MEIIIKSFNYNGKSFLVVKDNKEGYGEFYATIDKEFIKDGKLTKPLSMLEVDASKTLQDALLNRKNTIDIDEFVTTNKIDPSKREDMLKLANFIKGLKCGERVSRKA